MTARTRTAKKAADAAPAPAKKTAAKRTPAKPRAARTTRTRKTTPALSLVKDPPAPDGTKQPTGTIVDLRYPLKPRRRLFVGPMGPTEQAAIRAALASAALRLPVPVSSWNGSAANLTDGTLLIHNPGPDRTFTAQIACRRGGIHGYPITSAVDLKTARALTRACERRHTDATDAAGIQLDWHKAVSHGVAAVTQPKAPAVHFLREGVRRAEATKADTQPMPLDDIADGLAARTADAETPKEHPEP